MSARRAGELGEEKSGATRPATLPGMANLEIVQAEFHGNGRAAPFWAAIVDDPKTGDTKLVICFDEPDHVAVLSLEGLQDEDISAETNGWRGDKYEEVLRDILWSGEAT